MEPVNAVNVRIDGNVAEQLAKRAQQLGIPRQQLIDMILQREVTVGVAWGQPIALAAGLLPISGELEKAAGSHQKWVIVYRVRESDPFVIILGMVAKALPTMLYVQPPGDRLYVVLRSQLHGWQAYENDSELFDILYPWFWQGATLHPSAPRRWHQDLAQHHAEVLRAMRRG